MYSLYFNTKMHAVQYRKRKYLCFLYGRSADFSHT